MIKSVECQSLGGGMGLGFRLAGFHSLAKVEQTGGFGFPQYRENEHLLGTPELIEGNLADWPKFEAPVVYGCPPCSGFSMMSVRAGSKERRDYRGPDAAINSCMWDLVAYAASCNASVVVMESVPTAGREGGKGGAGLMRQLRDYMEQLTGRKYALHHCFHNGAALGGAAVRRRYFMVLSAIPFGVIVPEIERVPWMREVIGDVSFPDTSSKAPQPYVTPPTWWSEDRRNADDLVDGNVTFFDVFDSAHGRRVESALQTGDWNEGDQLVDVLRRHYEKHGDFPNDPAWQSRAAQEAVLWRPLEKQRDYRKVLAGKMTEAEYCASWKTGKFPPSEPTPWQGGAYQPKRWHAERAGRVLAGNGLTDVIHPWLDRTLTYREAARIMGFPDAWRVGSYMENRGGAAVFGKAVLVESAMWIASSVRHSLHGDTDDLLVGDEVGDREYVSNLSNIHRDIYNERTGERKERV